MNKIQNHIAGVISITNFSEHGVTLVTSIGHDNLTMSGSQLCCAAEKPELSVLYNTKIALQHLPECFGEYINTTTIYYNEIISLLN